MSSILKVDTIQDQDGNNIINENADTITIGASGDTISIPSGATLDASNATLTLPDDSVTTAKIDDGAVTTAKIADANITTAKLAYDPNPFRNIVINGDMSIAQRSTSVTSITIGSYYTMDRWVTTLPSGSLGTWTQSKSTDTPTGQGFASSLKMDCTTANASPSASANLVISQRFEGQNLQYLKKGTASATSLTASFWVKSTKTGTFICELEDLDNTRQVSASYTVSVTNTWEKKTITFPADATGAFTNDNGSSLQLRFWLGAGTDFTSGTLQTTWASTVSANRAVGQVNIADDTANDWYITGVQLEAGTTASDFEFLPVDVNLGRCLRYCEVYEGSSSGVVIPQGIATVDVNNRAESIINYTRKRASPTISVNTLANLRVLTMANTVLTPTTFATSIGTGIYGTNMFSSVASGVTVNTLSGICYYVFNASAKITISAEI
jgi:hypothetical protein